MKDKITAFAARNEDGTLNLFMGVTPYKRNIYGNGYWTVPDNEIENILKENNIEFIPQYNEKVFSRQRIDFFIPSKKIAIECQGQQHFLPFSFTKKIWMRKKIIYYILLV